VYKHNPLNHRGLFVLADPLRIINGLNASSTQ